MYVNALNGPMYIKDLLADAADYVGRKVISSRLVENIYVEIEIVKGFDSCCIQLDHTSMYPKTFGIEIGSQLGTYNKVKAVAHEIMHVKQHATNQYRYMKNGMKWEGDLYSFEKIEKSDYWQLPWELEAFSREEGLALSFCSDRFYKDKLWYRRRYSV